MVTLFVPAGMSITYSVALGSSPSGWNTSVSVPSQRNEPGVRGVIVTGGSLAASIETVAIGTIGALKVTETFAAIGTSPIGGWRATRSGPAGAVLGGAVASLFGGNASGTVRPGRGAGWDASRSAKVGGAPPSGKPGARASSSSVSRSPSGVPRTAARGGTAAGLASLSRKPSRGRAATFAGGPASNGGTAPLSRQPTTSETKKTIHAARSISLLVRTLGPADVPGRAAYPHFHAIDVRGGR
ncbi:MAG: hypothetical protein U0235_23340 [Polyangiaceae bacterium]